MKNKKEATMKIEVWSDFLCPYCYVGKRNLENALKQFAHKDEVEIIHRSFELHPEAPLNGGIKAMDSSSPESVKQWQRIKAYAATVGLHYDIYNIHIDNTMNAHRLVKMAEEIGKDDEITERFFHAHFVEGKNIADNELLISIATSVGLDKNDVQAVLNSTKYTDMVKADEQDAEQLNFEYIPAYYINRTYGINGVKSSKDILNLLNNPWNGTNLTGIDSTDGPACGIHGCN